MKNRIYKNVWCVILLANMNLMSSEHAPESQRSVAMTGITVQAISAPDAVNTHAPSLAAIIAQFKTAATKERAWRLLNNQSIESLQKMEREAQSVLQESCTTQQEAAAQQLAQSFMTNVTQQHEQERKAAQNVHQENIKAIYKGNRVAITSWHGANLAACGILGVFYASTYLAIYFS